MELHCPDSCRDHGVLQINHNYLGNEKPANHNHGIIYPYFMPDKEIFRFGFRNHTAISCLGPDTTNGLELLSLQTCIIV